MYVPAAAALPAGRRVLTPHEINAEMKALVGEAGGGIDRENVPPGVIVANQVAAGELQQVWRDEQVVDPRTSVLTDALHPGALQPIPDDAGFDWVFAFDTEEDGDVRVTFGGSVQGNVPGLDAGAHLALELEGQIIGRLDSASRMRGICWEMDGRAPIPAGRHLVRFLWGFRATVDFGTTFTMEWRQCCAIIHWTGR